MVLVDGAVSYGLGHGDHVATPAALTLLPPGVPHDGRPAADGQPYRKWVLYLEPEWLPEPARGHATRQPTLGGSDLVAATRRIHTALRTPGDLGVAEHRLGVVREQLLERLGTPERFLRDAPLAKRLRDLLDDRFTESFTIADAARTLETHPSHLVRAFSQAYGIAPHRYLVSRRVDLARRLLGAGTAPADAAQAAGFYDQSHLTRHFRRVLGVTPKTYCA